MDRNVRDIVVLRTSVDAARAQLIHKAATWIAIQMNMDHICHFQEVWPLQTFWSVKIDNFFFGVSPSKRKCVT